MTAHTRDDFSSITESAPLVAELRARIERDGPITFRDFMNALLYNAKHGYYATSSAMTSRGGDYVTSPEVHPVFGALVARQLHQLWRRLGSRATFDVVEQGAGRGLLARDILSWAAERTGFAASIRYTIVEPREHLRIAQRSTLSDFLSSNVGWVDELPASIEGCVLTNELLDAFPVHRIVREGDRLREVYVAHDGARFVDHLGDVSDPAIAAYFDALDLLPGDGCYAEVNLEAPSWIELLAARIVRGFVLTFDYGYDATDLYAPWRRDGTLLCFYRQSVSSDPYQRIGRQDITSSIDFTTLRRAGERAGFVTAGFTDQTQFLLNLGINDALTSVSSGAQMEEYFARRKVVLDLVDPGRLGRIKVLLQAKGVDSATLTGFTDG